MLDDIRGFGFPFRIDPRTGGVASARGTDKIRQNVAVILGTRQGERPMLRDFGARVHALVQEANDELLGKLLGEQTQQALLQWEPRILVTKAAVEQSEGEARLRLQYTYTTEPALDEMVVPLR